MGAARPAADRSAVTLLRLKAVLAGSLVLLGLLGGCAKEPLTRDEADYPDNLLIPPEIVEEAERAPVVAERRPGRRDEGDAAEGSGSDEQTVPGRVKVADERVELRLDMPLNRVWINVGSALDRLDFTVLERERDDLRYVIRYAPRADEEVEQPGFFARVLGGAERIDTAPRRYRVTIEQQVKRVVVTVTADSGEPARKEVAERLLTFIDRELE